MLQLFQLPLRAAPAAKIFKPWVKIILFLIEYDKSVMYLTVPIVYKVHVAIFTSIQ